MAPRTVRRAADLDDPRHHSRRAARLRAVLPARLLCRAIPATSWRSGRAACRSTAAFSAWSRACSASPGATGSTPCGSATPWPRPPRSGSSSGASPISSTPSSGAARPTCPGAWSSRTRHCPDGTLETCARHPSQLYEAGLEGALLFLVILWAFRRGALKRPGRLIGIFFIGYGLVAAFVEFFRQADAQFITPTTPWAM